MKLVGFYFRTIIAANAVDANDQLAVVRKKNNLKVAVNEL